MCVPSFDVDVPPSPNVQKLLVWVPLVFVNVTDELIHAVDGPEKAAVTLPTYIYPGKVMLSLHPFASVTTIVTL